MLSYAAGPQCAVREKPISLFWRKGNALLLSAEPEPGDQRGAGVGLSESKLLQSLSSNHPPTMPRLGITARSESHANRRELMRLFRLARL